MNYFCQSTGRFFSDAKLLGAGYAGAPAGKNNPLMQAVRSVGPIPQGRWRIVGPPMDTPAHGPFVLHLSPYPETNTFGRSGFLIHGDNMSDPGNGSEGCIVLPRPAREAVWAAVLGGDADLTVVASEDQMAAC